jgi:ligand-binding sensor domain-containing protein
MKHSVLSIVTFFLYIFSVSAQEYSYTHYDSRDGLAGSTVYNITQDKEGFLWFATETGLSRFDGTHFKNFSQEDGLPDNEIIQLFSDSKGRVWLSPFRKTICYYYKGIIHNSENDSLLSRLHLPENVLRFAEDAEGDILLQEKLCLHLIHSNGQITEITSNNNKPLGYISFITGWKGGGFLVLLDNVFYILKNDRFTLWKPVQYEVPPHFNYMAFNGETLAWRSQMSAFTAFTPQGVKTLPYPYRLLDSYINMAVIDKDHVAACTIEGAYVYDINKADSITLYLPGITVSNMYKDSEGNLWFCTFGKGVYRLNSAVVLNLRSVIKDQHDYQILALGRYKDRILAATKLDQLLLMSAKTGKLEGYTSTSMNTMYPVFLASASENDRVVIGGKNFLGELAPELNTFRRVLCEISVKAMCRYKTSILVATEKNVQVIDGATFKIVDTIWNERATCIFSNNDTIYLGTLKGLYRILPDKKIDYLGEYSRFFQSRVAAITQDPNHVIWVATLGEGLIAWKDNQIIKHITRHDGLSSSICRTIFLENGNLWVGTDKGLSKVQVLQPGFPIEKYTTNDGLSSDIINCLYVLGKKVFIGTPEGLTFFDEDKMTSQSRCDLRIVDVTVGGKVYYPADAPSFIPHEKNNLQINYVGISYKSSGDIRYRYRLLGLDSTWHDTRETFLNYPTLPSGDYGLQLQAINKFGVYSEVLMTRFTIDKLMYEKLWFQVLVGLLFLTLTGFVVWLIVQRVRKREQEKTATNKRISELEQLSRKAQMNPHFIFNSLNSIQQYVMDADVAGANKFISGFSRLIRQTLDFSSRPEIRLEEELDYLTNYLDIEKTRLEDAFTWVVNIDKSVDPTAYYIPPMILQPFVENSVRHGLRFRRDRNGVVTITVKRDGDYLVCILEDNGIGRKAAMKYKSVQPINYQSKGLSLTADRIEMFNREHALKIKMWIDDLEDNFHNSLGTRVTIYFPVL